MLVDHFKAVVELGKLIDCAQDRIGDQVRVGSLTAIVFFPVPVNDAAVLVEQLNRNATLRSCGRNGEARFHVLDDFEGGAANRSCLRSRFRCRPGFGSLCCRGFCGRDTCSISTVIRLSGLAAVGLWQCRRANFGERCRGAIYPDKLVKISPPGFIHLRRIVAPTRQQALNISRVGAEVFGNNFR